MLASVNVIDLVVIGIILLLVVLIAIHLYRVYKDNPCGDCTAKKGCQAFSKKQIFKAYKKACKREK